MLSTLQRLVLAESPSLEKEPADRCCDILAAEWHKRGASVERIVAETFAAISFASLGGLKNRGLQANSSSSDITTRSIPAAL